MRAVCRSWRSVQASRSLLLFTVVEYQPLFSTWYLEGQLPATSTCTHVLQVRSVLLDDPMDVDTAGAACMPDAFLA